MNQQSLLSRLTLIIFFLAILFINSKAQSIVGVNNVTGTAYATVPVYNVSVGDISVPISLSYSASGLRVEDYDYTIGMGWRLSAYGTITRQVKGFPDDVEYQSDPGYSVIKGWIRPGNTARQTIQSTDFYNTSTSTLNCSGEITDVNTINNNYAYTYDTEPDVFYVSAPGLSCSFVFDGTSTPTIKTIPYRDYKITYTADYWGRIENFTVINENGIKYTFSTVSLTSTTVDIFNPGTSTPVNPSTLEAFRRDFMMYRNKADYPGFPLGYPVYYRDNWHLTNIEDTRGNKVIYTYDNVSYINPNPTIAKKTSYKEVEILKPNGSGGFTKKLLYGIITLTPKYKLKQISVYSMGIETGTSVPSVLFNWAGASGATEEDRLMSIELREAHKAISLIYTKKFLGATTVWYAFGRYFLKGVQITNYDPSYGTQCPNVYSQFDFTYYGVNEADNTCYCTPLNSNNVVIDTIINIQDYWGYYNGKVSNPNLNPQIYAYPDYPAAELFKVYQIPGYTTVTIPETADRSVSLNTQGLYAKEGSLKTITYPTGATTTLEYENNEFFDNDVNGNVQGGGIRIKKITENDGINITSSITEYSYNDPVSTGVTTGRAISVPKFAFTFRNTTSYGNNTDRIMNSTYRTTYDLNDEAKEILYGKVTVSRAGIGKTIYEYNTSATFGTASATDWSATVNSVARTDLSSPTPCNPNTPAFLKNGYLQYPFVSNPNFDFERGLLNKVTQYDINNQVVSREEYTYSRSHVSPTKIYAVKTDDIGNTEVAYGRYWINAAVDNFLTTKTSKLYNSNHANPVTETEYYDYTSPGSGESYRLLKAVRKQNSSDPATSVSTFKYAKEYAATSSGSDVMNAALYNFNNNHRNEVIETTQSRQEPGQPEKFLGGSLSTFKQINIGDPVWILLPAWVPDKAYRFANPAGITGFTPSSISSDVFIRDAAYDATPPAETEQYNARGVPQVISDHSRIPKTRLSTVQANGVTVAEFTNAKTEQVGFSNFDGWEYTGMFSLGGNSVLAGEGRYSDNCLNFQPNTTICRLINKSTTAKNLVVSFWLKNAQTSGYIYICYHKFGGACGTFSCSGSATTVAFTASGQWKYYQVIIPWVSLLGAVSYGLSTSTAVKIDDVLIYPDNASVITYSYTSNSTGRNMLTAKTGVNGIGNTYEYDRAGRLWLVRDQFDNIIEMKKYRLLNRHIQQIPSIDIGYPYYPVKDQPATFHATPPFVYETGDCDAPPIEYTWDFGDGGTGTSYGTGEKGGTSINHIYTSIGKKQVTVVASSPGMTNITAQTPPTGSTNPPPVEVVNAPEPCYPGTPVICASGITRYTSSGQCILSTCNTLPALPSTCSATYFKVIGNTGGQYSSIYSAQWEISSDGGATWYVHQPEPLNGAAGGLQTSLAFHIVHTTTYSMRARVRFCDKYGSTAYSNSIEVKNGD